MIRSSALAAPLSALSSGTPSLLQLQDEAAVEVLDCRGVLGDGGLGMCFLEAFVEAPAFAFQPQWSYPPVLQDQ